MENTAVSLADTLGEFVTTVSNTVAPADVLAVYGKALAAGVGIFLVVFGAKKIVRTFVSSLNGHIGV